MRLDRAIGSGVTYFHGWLILFESLREWNHVTQTKITKSVSQLRNASVSFAYVMPITGTHRINAIEAFSEKFFSAYLETPTLRRFELGGNVAFQKPADEPVVVS